MRYPALVTVMTILKVIAAIQAALGLVMFFIGLRYGFFAALAILVGAILSAVMVFAMAQLIAVILDIEDNTRRTADSAGGQMRTTPSGA